MNENRAMKTPAVIYAAKSTEDKHGSIPTQLEDCRKMAKREGWEVVAEFDDEGFSAYSGNRGPDLVAARAKAAEHAPAVLIVQHSDRLSRGSGDAPGAAEHLAEILFWANRHGVQLRSVQDDFAFTNPLLAPVIASIMGMRNHEDSKRKSAATSAGKKRRVQRGRPNGRTPYGYRVEGRLDDARLVVDGAQAAIVRRIFESLAAGESQLSIARALNREGVQSQRGGKWAQGTLWSLVRKPVYIGKVSYQGEVFDGEHEPIVDAELFEKVRRILDSNVSKRGRRSIGTHLFRRGMLRCGQCGSAMIPRSTRRKDGSLYTTYQCIGRRNEGPEFCSQPDVRRDLVDGAALGYFETVGLDVDATRAAFEQSIGSKRAEVKALADQADRERLQKLDALQRVEDDYLAGKISGDSWERLQAKLQGELAALAAQSEQLRSQEEDVSHVEAELDAEAAMLERLSGIRRAVIGDVRSAEGLDAARAAIGSLFESFTLVKPSGPLSVQQVLQRVARGDDRGRSVLAGMLGADIEDVEAIAPVEQVASVSAAELALVPSVRREALAGLTEGFSPVMHRVPLEQRANNYLMNSVSAYLFAPIAVVEEHSVVEHC